MTLNIDLSLTARHLGSRLILDGGPFVGGICFHDTAGSGKHNDTLYLSNPSDGRTVSVDFTVERDGHVYQLNPDLKRFCTWHAGRATKWKVGNRSFRNRAVTQVLIGVELVQKNDLSLLPLWPGPQVEAAADLAVYLCGKFGLDKTQITTHAAIITDNSRSDPRRFPWADFWFIFNRRANTPATDPRPSPESIGSPVFHTVKPGETLWSISKRYGVPIETLKANNGMSTASNLIIPGQALFIQR